MRPPSGQATNYGGANVLRPLSSEPKSGQRPTGHIVSLDVISIPEMDTNEMN
jgi:hypothetical protein